MEYVDEKGNKMYGFSVSDMEQYNQRLSHLSIWIKVGVVIFGILGLWALLIITWVIWKVISSGAVNNYIARCVC